jgi:hypothetical protein
MCSISGKHGMRSVMDASSYDGSVVMFERFSDMSTKFVEVMIWLCRNEGG